MRRKGSNLRFAIVFFGATSLPLAAGCEDERSQVDICKMDCAQKFACDHASQFAAYFGDEESCVEACKSWELPDGCLSGVPEACTDARLDRWACAASLSCGELDAFLDEAQNSHWELVENEDGSFTWEQSEGDYPCNSEDAKVQDECTGIEWAGFSAACGYDGGYVETNYYDEEFYDL